MKEVIQAMDDYLAVSGPDQTPRAVPVERSDLPNQPSALEISLKAMAEAVTQQTLLLQQVLERVGQKAARQQKGCFKCGGPHMQRDCPQSGKQPSTFAKAETGKVWHRLKLLCDQIPSFGESQLKCFGVTRWIRWLDDGEEELRRQEAGRRTVREAGGR